MRKHFVTKQILKRQKIQPTKISEYFPTYLAGCNLEIQGMISFTIGGLNFWYSVDSLHAFGSCNERVKLKTSTFWYKEKSIGITIEIQLAATSMTVKTFSEKSHNK